MLNTDTNLLGSDVPGAQTKEGEAKMQVAGVLL